MKNVNFELINHLKKIIDIPETCVGLCLRMSTLTAPVIEFTCRISIESLHPVSQIEFVTERFVLTPLRETETDKNSQCIGSFDCNAGDHSDACPQVGE